MYTFMRYVTKWTPNADLETVFEFLVRQSTYYVIIMWGYKQFGYPWQNNIQEKHQHWNRKCRSDVGINIKQ